MQRELLLLVLLVVCGIVLALNGNRVKAVPGSSIAGIRNPGLAMEFASSASEVSGLLDTKDPDQAARNRSALRIQQWIDFLFIFLYWALFFYVIGGALLKSAAPTASALGIALAILITIAALADVLEDIGILLALRPQYNGGFWPFHFGVTKWLCFFLALLVSSQFFLRYPRLGTFPVTPSWWHFLAIVIGVFFLGSSLIGLAGTLGAVRGNGAWIIVASYGFPLPFLLLLIWFWVGTPTHSSRPVAAQPTVLENSKKLR